MNAHTRRRFLASATAVLALCLWLFCGCAGAPSTGSSQPEISSDEAIELLGQLNARFETGEFEAAEFLAREIITAYPDFPRLDEVLHIAAKASYSAESYTQTVKYATRLSDRYALSPYREETLLLAADAYEKLGAHYESADVLSQLLALPIEPELRERCLEELRRMAVEKLGVSDLERLVDAYPYSPLAAEMSLGLAKKEFARGNYDRSYALLADLLYEFPQHSHSREIRYLLQLSASRRENPEKLPEYVEPNKLGVVLPYTGDYSRFGRHFEEGIRLAIDDHNASVETSVRVVFADSKADPVDAVSAARKLILEEGVVGVMGSVFTMPTIAAATECNAWKVPMVSPMVSDQRIGEIGPWIFQTQVPVEVEVTAMARLAVEDLLLEKIAVFSPSAHDGRTVSDFFVREVERRGGEIVSVQYYDVGDTDFREQLEAIREAAPDALFIPGAPDELINILPQIGFYDLQIQLLGLSRWNSDKLLRLSGRELEGAVFPREGYYGKDPEAYQRFVVRYAEAHADEHGGSSGVDDVHPIAAAGYFGIHFLLDAIDQGAVDREQVRELLDAELDAGAESRMKESDSLALLRVTSGRVRDFTPPRREEK